jgi:hypothetical protein
MRCAALLLAMFAATAHADDDGAVSGFEATGSGELRGRAVDADHNPLRQIEVHVVSKNWGEQIVKTDDDGNYKVVLKGASTETSMIFIRGHRGAHIGGSVAESTTIDGQEAIEIHETAPTVTPARPVNEWIRILPYSKKALLDDEWTRAWMTLDVDDKGQVLHLKWIRRPGHDLDDIAMREAFDIRFNPARDSGKHAMPSRVVWMFEWPSHSWLTDHRYFDITRMPSDFTTVACQKDGEHRRDRRDCSQADVTTTLGEVWLSKPPPLPPIHKR